LDRTLSDGLHTFTATTTDAAGNVSAASAPLAITIDTSPPTTPTPTLAIGSDSGISASDGITNVATPTITGSAPSGDLITLIDSDGATVLGIATAVNGTWSITPTVPLSDGPHSLTVTDKDVAGNISVASAPLQLTIDTVGPNARSILSSRPRPVPPSWASGRSWT
jgi:hypothetical protein